MEINYDGLQFNEIKQQIADYCCFSNGQQLVMDSYPSFRKLVVKTDLDRLKQALQMTIKQGSMPFAGVYDIVFLVETAMKDGTLNPEELLKIADQCYAVKAIKDYVKLFPEEGELIRELTDTLEANEFTATSITNAINRSGAVNDNASAELRRLRRSITALQGRIAERMNRYINANRQYLQEDIIAQRNQRSVVLIKNNYKNTVEGLQYGQSASGGATYLEPAEMIPLNNELQNLVDSEAREVQRILHALSQEVKKDGVKYLANLDTLALLDSIFARAQWAKEHDAIVADISENMDLIIEKGRHPLIDRRKVVANSYHIQDPIRTILITGPNTGGKTVSLKLIGLFTIMHLSGMAVPCDYASIPIYDNVFYDIGDNQSIEDDLSTFSAHIRNLAFICDNATDHSLVILDELGSGTDPLEGQALASAVLDHFRRRHIYTVATTHYSKLKAYGQHNDDVMLASVEFDQENLKPTYRYLEDSIGQSNALEIAERYGMSSLIIERAHQFKQEQQQPEDRVMENLQQQLDVVRQRSEQLEIQLQAVADEKKELDSQKEEMTRKQHDILEDARQRAYEIVEEAREESEEIIEQLKAQQNYSISDVARLKHQLSELAEAPQEEEITDDTPLAVGDYVRITLTNQVGEIIAIDKKNATVLCGNTRIRSSLGNLAKTARPQAKKETQARARVQHSGSFKIECNLIGMRVDEALPVLDKFMDDALLANAPFVRIIHGVGTGALRKAVWDRLKKYKFVKKYEVADGASGGSGATVVTLRES